MPTRDIATRQRGWNIGVFPPYRLAFTGAESQTGLNPDSQRRRPPIH